MSETLFSRVYLDGDDVRKIQGTTLLICPGGYNISVSKIVFQKKNKFVTPIKQTLDLCLGSDEYKVTSVTYDDLIREGVININLELGEHELIPNADLKLYMSHDLNPEGNVYIIFNIEYTLIPELK
jgi:hypothetical protein